MAKTDQAKPIEKRGGYSAGDKLVSELKPPPSGPAPGAKSAKSSGQNSDSSRDAK
jgi:hypothetical protein